MGDDVNPAPPLRDEFFQRTKIINLLNIRWRWRLRAEILLKQRVREWANRLPFGLRRNTRHVQNAVSPAPSLLLQKLLNCGCLRPTVKRRTNPAVPRGGEPI